MKLPLSIRFWRHVNKAGPNECWLWTGSKNRKGYGQIGDCIKGRWRTVLAHRVSYELNIGPILEGLTIDHVKARGCVSRACVNPTHLEAVTIIENIKRGNSPSAVAYRNSTCMSGRHPLTPENRRKSGGCRTCSNEYMKQYMKQRCESRKLVQIAQS